MYAYPSGSSKILLVEEIRSKLTSPFWRTRPANSRNGSSNAPDSKIVVGASYSHADMLKFDSL